ncbi:hypothetical protein [Ktedonospora formicarum]|uniref:Uncharacterized protein n=1 Tax=Ktedonospora formicarum TaxID=2778364 RepID=A0A8J3MVK7_9CHLR|nr:hypothetical protein [Ktedonospora formicarum]GHO49435.1 hypothetical protein KSX_75980 [Ktedonospora formicarum]
MAIAAMTVVGLVVFGLMIGSAFVCDLKSRPNGTRVTMRSIMLAGLIVSGCIIGIGWLGFGFFSGIGWFDSRSVNFASLMFGMPIDGLQSLFTHTPIDWTNTKYLGYFIIGVIGSVIGWSFMLRLPWAGGEAKAGSFGR